MLDYIFVVLESLSFFQYNLVVKSFCDLALEIVSSQGRHFLDGYCYCVKKPTKSVSQIQCKVQMLLITTMLLLLFAGYNLYWNKF